MNNINSVKQQLLESALRIVPFEGWSLSALDEICKKAGYELNTDQLFFPNGPLDFIKYYHQQLDQRMVTNINSQNLGVRESISKALFWRFEQYEKDRIFVINSFRLLCLPSNFFAAKQLHWKTVDLIWYDIGLDKSTDFNYYSKRGLLYMVYTSAFLYWISDDSENLIDTKNYVIRRLNSVVSLGKNFSKIKTAVLEKFRCY
jgi:ubiquinone biosynthesis protein COQ9